ncbi:MAG: hypothetical protein V4635_13280 [Bacteroidota bacterium]
MKKNIIATIIGTIILFGWQALSWMALPVHNDTMKYSAGQQEVMTALQKNLPASGTYYLPGADPAVKLSSEEMESFYKAQIGKPWALVFYNTSFEGMSPSNMINGILLNLLSVVLVIALLHMSKAKEKQFAAIFGLVMILPVFVILQSVLQNANWWSFPWHFIKGTIVDLIFGWLLCGLYLSWHFRKLNMKT